MLSTREIVLSKVINENPLTFVRSSRENLYETENKIVYAVLTEEESVKEISEYFKEERGGYWFSIPFLTELTGKNANDIEAYGLRIEKGEVENTQGFIKFIENTCGLESLTKKCVETNGGYGYYINQDHNLEVPRYDNYLIYTFSVAY